MVEETSLSLILLGGHPLYIKFIIVFQFQLTDPAVTESSHDWFETFSDRVLGSAEKVRIVRRRNTSLAEACCIIEVRHTL